MASVRCALLFYTVLLTLSSLRPTTLPISAQELVLLLVHDFLRSLFCPFRWSLGRVVAGLRRETGQVSPKANL